jgi:hypothetical protein
MVWKRAALITRSLPADLVDVVTDMSDDLPELGVLEPRAGGRMKSERTGME